MAAKGIKEFVFPTDLFSAQKINLHENQQDDVNVNLSTYFDGLVGISEEGQLNFLTGIPGTIVWQKNSVACWAPATQFKEIDINMFENGLPLFRIGQVNNLPL